MKKQDQYKENKFLYAFTQSEQGMKLAYDKCAVINFKDNWPLRQYVFLSNEKSE